MREIKATSNNTICLPYDKDLGPAMRALNPLQQSFVIALLETGARDNTQAARLAGYTGSEQAMRNQGFRLSHNPKVLAAIREEADKRLQSGAILAASGLVEIARDPFDKNRFKACVELLNRAGLLVETRHRVVVDDNRTPDQIRDAILLLAKQNGLDPRALLGQTAGMIETERAAKADVEDAEFVEVVPAQVDDAGLEQVNDDEW